jgi:tRNA-guanine family transglycosylase
MKFLTICPEDYVPMATIHGMDIEERVKHARTLYARGYTHLALGGLAARAASRNRVVSWVSAVRQAVPDAYLHVLGLTSPNYMRMWHELGVNSADGSSHFKQAFTAGAFFSQEGDKLTKHAAARTGQPITAPECVCLACRLLREDGVDTRTYGSNETNMGRAAHNLNMLMRAHKWTLSTSSLV